MSISCCDGLFILSLVTFLFFLVEKKRGCFSEFWFGAIFLLTVKVVLVSMCASDFSAYFSLLLLRHLHDHSF